jgi:hypothetical protein
MEDGKHESPGGGGIGHPGTNPDGGITHRRAEEAGELIDIHIGMGKQEEGA